MARRLKLTSLRLGLGVLCLLLATLAVGIAGLYFHWYRAPYPAFGKRFAWMVGLPEPAYNFGVVQPGKLFRSGRPDDRFVAYVHRKYGVRHIISLIGDVEADETARKLGMTVTVFDWTHGPPTAQELRAMLEALDKNDGTLVHCNAGRDRTGYVIAIHRMREQRWSLDRAIQEMEYYGKNKSRRSENILFLRKLLQDFGPS